MGPRAGLGGWKISFPPEFDPGPSSPLSVTIPTELPGPLAKYVTIQISKNLKTNSKYRSHKKSHNSKLRHIQTHVT